MPVSNTPPVSTALTPWDRLWVAARLLTNGDPVFARKRNARGGLAETGEACRQRQAGLLHSWIDKKYGVTQPLAEAPTAHSFFQSLLADDTASQTHSPRMLAAVEKAEADLKAPHVGMAFIYGLECKVAPIFKQMTAQGVYVDVPKLTALRDRELLGEQHARTTLARAFGERFNPQATGDLKNFFGSKGMVLHGYSRDDFAALKHPLGDAMVQFDKATRLQGECQRYLLAVDDHGYLHPAWDPIATATGRSQCYNPYLVGVAKSPELRACFAAPPGYKLGISDVNALDLRTMAHMSKDKQLIAAFQSGQDVHSLTAGRIYGKKPEDVTKEQRNCGKLVNNAAVNNQRAGGLQHKLAEEYGIIISLGDAKGFQSEFAKMYPDVKAFQDRASQQAMDRNVTESRTLNGRRLLLPAYAGDDSYWDRLTGLTTIPTQGTGADGLKRALMRLGPCLAKRVNPDGKFSSVANFIHDEFVTYHPEETAAEDLKFTEKTISFSVSEMTAGQMPYVVESCVGDHWGDKGGHGLSHPKVAAAAPSPLRPPTRDAQHAAAREVAAAAHLTVPSPAIG